MSFDCVLTVKNTCTLSWFDIACWGSWNSHTWIRLLNTDLWPNTCHSRGLLWLRDHIIRMVNCILQTKSLVNLLKHFIVQLVLLQDATQILLRLGSQASIHDQLFTICLHFSKSLCDLILLPCECTASWPDWSGIYVFISPHTSWNQWSDWYTLWPVWFNRGGRCIFIPFWVLTLPHIQSSFVLVLQAK